jgi:hypothetical protein
MSVSCKRITDDDRAERKALYEIQRVGEEGSTESQMLTHVLKMQGKLLTVAGEIVLRRVSFRLLCGLPTIAYLLWNERDRYVRGCVCFQDIVCLFSFVSSFLDCHNHHVDRFLRLR